MLIQIEHLGMKEPMEARNRLLKFKSNTNDSPAANRIPLPEEGSAADPRLGGAVVRIYNSAGLTSDDATIELPASGWKLIRKTGNPDVYRFKARHDAPIERVLVMKDRLIIRGEGARLAYTLDEPAQGSIAVRLELGSGIAFCAEAASPRQDRMNRFVARREPPPPACP